LPDAPGKPRRGLSDPQGGGGANMVKNLTAAALVSLLTGGLIGIVFGMNQVERTNAAIVADLERDARLAVDTVELLVRNLRLAVATVSANIDPDDISGSAEIFWPSIQEEWRDFRTVLVIDLSGTIVADLGRGGAAVGTNVSFRDYFREIISGRRNIYYVDAPIISQFDGRWTLPVSAPILDENQLVRGVVTASVEYGYFNPETWQTLGRQTHVHLVAMDSGEVFGLEPDETLLEPGARVEPAVLDAMAAAQGAAPRSLSIPGQQAYVAATSHNTLGVIVSRTEAGIRDQAVRAGFLTGGLAAIIASGLIMVFLRGRVVLKRVRRDAARLRMLEERQRLATNAGGIGVWDQDIRSGALVWDDLMHRHYGTDPENFGGRYEDWRARLHPEDAPRVIAAFQQALKAGTDFSSQFRILTPSGEERTLLSQATIAEGADGSARHMIGVNLDVTREVANETALKAALEKIEQDATHDVLTGIGNRRGFFNHVEALAQSHPADSQIAVLLLDIDQYKLVNDVFGHTGGDHLLTVVAGNVGALLGPQDFVARIGGDEFAVVLFGPRIRRRALELGQRIVEMCREPVPLRESAIRYTVSIGVALGPLGAAQRLLEDADIALYEAKNSGRNQFQLFTREMRVRSQEKKLLADDLVVGLEQGQIGIRLQPQVCSRTGALAGAEVLMRWWHPLRGELAPLEFLPLASEIGLVKDLDALVLRQAIEAAQNLARQGIVLPSLSLNLSIERLIDRALMSDLAVLERFPGELIFELLEVTDFSCQNKDVFDRINDLRGMGIRLAVDDFGSGHASLTTLLTLNPDYVKIDKRLVIEGTVEGRHPSPFLTTIADLCRRLNIALIAEGVETSRSVEMMAALGVETLQGYFFAKPLMLSEFSDWAHGRDVPSLPVPPPEIETRID
jgi:diguanylate cyclase (GGDEF)-like protein